MSFRHESERLNSRFDVNNTKPNPVVNFEGVSKNVMAIGFEDEGRWMYTGLFKLLAIANSKY